MYQSPVEIMINNVIKKQNEALENEVYSSILGVGINVDKEELIKALRYDRKQYARGYRDGMQEFAERLKEKIGDLHFQNYGLAILEINSLVNEMCGE